MLYFWYSNFKTQLTLFWGDAITNCFANGFSANIFGGKSTLVRIYFFLILYHKLVSGSVITSKFITISSCFRQHYAWYVVYWTSPENVKFSCPLVSLFLSPRSLKFRTAMLNLGKTYCHFKLIYSQLKIPDLLWSSRYYISLLGLKNISVYCISRSHTTIPIQHHEDKARSGRLDWSAFRPPSAAGGPSGSLAYTLTERQRGSESWRY